ncbi:hypothetical protein BBBOND_0314050 [Babesia bigemina]|uniref:C3H1-type domain-containing protein n=1 Tax=Babesia bigemina TaxID=5866 RepID=A0A061DAC7_BABBI|nr:hypothetical protein BBBOND_0314050 [Babesia bigemina]CDR97503.1 hypothetical protein BBBOND_0314050 [Babesia bigemina]|eukprot:XP_012769689.1 hypothetical protein BBBOND_0314050 [Babesia bigemina]
MTSINHHNNLYGNGGSDGLTKLSQALKKLIEEAIEKATNSLNDRQSKLLCRGKPTDESSKDHPSVQPCCKQQQKTIDDTKEQLKSKLANQTDDSKKQIDELNAKIKKAEASKNDCAKTHYLPQEERQKGLQEVEQQREIVKKLETFAKELEKHANDNLLTHLCDGLQTFLGYSPNSKGYDGTGIVYSDLDRLCDGVMGFLSGVLEGVKDDDAVKKYDKSMSPNDFNRIINLLNDNNGKGAEGLKAVLSQVKSHLVSYQNKVSKEVTAVSGPLYELEDSVNENVKKVEEQKSMTLDKQFTAWSGQVKGYGDKVREANEAMKNIDEQLKKQLVAPLAKIDGAVNVLEKSATDDLKAACRVVDSSLGSQKQKLLSDVNKRVPELRIKVENKLDEVIKQIGHIGHIRTTRLTELIASTKEALESVKQAVDSAYDLSTIYERDIVQKIERIERQVEKIDTDDVASDLQEILMTVGQHLVTLGKLHDTITSELEHEFYDLKGKLYSDVQTLYGDIKQQVGGYLQELATAIKAGINTSSGVGRPRFSALVSTLNKRNPLEPDTDVGRKLSQANNGNLNFANAMESVLVYLKNASSANGGDPKPSDVFHALTTEFDSKIDSAQNQLNPLLRSAALRGTAAFKEALNLRINGRTHDVTGGIKKDIQDQIEKLDVASDDDMTEDGEIQKKIKTLQSSIDETEELIKKLRENAGKKDSDKDGVKDLVEALKDKVGGTLTNIHDVNVDLEAFNASIENAIQAAESTANSARQEIASGLETLISGLTAAIEVVFAGVKSDVQAFFATVREGQLSTFRGIIVEQNEQIADVIKDDEMNGVKGLLGKIKDGLNSLKSNNNVKTVTGLSAKAYSLLKNIVTYSNGDLQKLDRNFDQLQNFEKYIEKLASALNLYAHFSHPVSLRLSALSSATSALDPQALPDAGRPVLKALQAGMLGFVEELEKGYVNRYDGGESIKQWVKKGEKDVLTPEGKNGAKVFLTVVDTLFHELEDLRKGCKTNGKWNDEHVRQYEMDNGGDITPNSLGLWFSTHGFKVSRNEHEQNGELDRRKTGAQIMQYLMKQLNMPPNYKPIYDNQNQQEGTLNTLHEHLETYFRVNHYYIPPNPRAPTTVYEMLQWLCGLWYNPVRNGLIKTMVDLFGDNGELDVYMPEEIKKYLKRPALYPTTFMRLLPAVCAQSYTVLVGVQGHGHAEGRYACDFYTNSDKLAYPTNMNTLLCTLQEYLKRLHHQLYFLYEQCSHDSELSGWQDCHYGRHVGGSAWNCNAMQCVNQEGNQLGDQTCKQTCDQHPNCGLKSPLQSFLEDGLQGFLPHALSSKGATLSCSTCLKTPPGMPCRTPMGFPEISSTASHTKTGDHIYSALLDFCCTDASPLNVLCAMLNTLLPSAPKTLGDMFAFYSNFTYRWGMDGNEHKYKAFNDAATAANLEREYSKPNVGYLFSESHSAAWKGHSAGSLASLVCTSNDAVVCGPYLRPINKSIYVMFSSKHADKYLSWIVYLTQTFYDLLKKLYEECNSKCGSKGYNCHAKACIKGCPTTSSKETTPSHNEQCKSIVTCKYTMPTLCKYGFTLWDKHKLNGDDNINKKRTCKDFSTVFEETFKKDSHLVQFFTAIDEFIFTIRAPFIWLNVALWLLSVLYLIIVMVIRLDLLHIKSHLHSPSSHRIAAQSLLAAGRVNKLNRVFYLQP